MHIKIDAECRRGLRIIDDIPNIRLCKLEGYNGIGKTSAIRLLRLCTGEQPFENNAAAWRTFRDQLVRAHVRITDLRQANVIEWHLEPSRWLDEQAEPLKDQMIAITIDGHRATLRDIEPLLKVHHLNTTETPAKILMDRTSAAATALEDWYIEQGAPRGEQLDHLLDPVLRILGNTHTTEIRLRREVASAASKAANDVASLAANARARVQQLEKAVDVADRLDTVRGSSPQIDTKLRSLSESLAAIDKANESLDTRLANAHLQQRQTQEALERYDKAKRLVARHDASLRKSKDALMRAAAEANVDPTYNRIAQMANEVSRRLNALVEAQPDVSAAPQVLALLNNLSRPLDDAIASNLGDRIIIEKDELHPELTVAALRDACRLQIERLLERSRRSDANLLTAEIASARNRLDALARAEESLRAVQKFETWLEHAEAGLDEAGRDLAHDAGDQVNELLHERSEREKAGRELQSRIDRLRLELDLLGGGHTEEALATDLELLCQKACVEPSRVRGSLERERAELAELSQQEAEARMNEHSEIRALNQRLEEIERIVETLAADESLTWLRHALPNVSQLPLLDFDGRLNELDSLTKILGTARDTFTATITGVRGIGGALDALAKLLGNAAADVKRPQLWTAPAGRWLAQQVRQWFDDGIMRETLFSGGHNVQLDPSDLTVSWELDGEEHKRPLGFFSSGEQAFAFTRARVAQLDRGFDPVANRLIALDEFGAFLDAKRFRRMAKFLTQREEHTPRDQVLVILPCSVVPVGDTDDARVLTSREAELADRGYYAEALRV